MQNELNYIASELHPYFGALFNPSVSNEVLQFFRDRVDQKLQYLEKHIGDRPYLVDDSFTIADAYLYIVLSWAPHLSIDLAKYPKVRNYYEHINQLPYVQQAHSRMATNPSTIL